MKCYKYKPLCYTMPEVFEIAKAIILVAKLSLSPSLILWVRTIKTSAVNPDEKNPYCLSLRKLFLISKLFLYNRLNEFVNDTKDADEAIF